MSFSLSIPHFQLPTFRRRKIIKWDDYFQIYREPIVTYSITPNNSPELNVDRNPTRMGRRRSGTMNDFYRDIYSDAEKSDMILNTITGLFSKFYLPERIRFSKQGIKVKLSDVVGYKVVFHQGQMKFYLTVPKRWAKSFTNAIKRDWGQVDITKVEEDVIKFNPNKAKAMDIILKHHHFLSIKHSVEKDTDPLYESLSSLASTLDNEDKLIIDYNIKPLNNDWKNEAKKQMQKFKNGTITPREEKSLRSLIFKIFEFGNIAIEEMTKMIYDLMSVDYDEEKIKEQLWKLEYSDKKLYENSKGYEVQIRSIAESPDSRKSKHMLKAVKSSFTTLDGDNQFTVRHIRTKRGIKSIINAVEKNKPLIGKGKDIFFEKEMNQLLKIPSKDTLKEYSKIIEQDNFTRTEIHNDFLKENPYLLAKTLDKESKNIYMPDYEREWWTEKGRKAIEKSKLDDNSRAEMFFGQQGSGKTSVIVRRACQKFGVHLPKEEWKEKSKSVVAFDVADGEILAKVWNQVPPRLRDRVIILNHAVPERPVPVNFAELQEFNNDVMKDPDYAYTMAEMESHLMRDILKSGESVYVDRWFTTALQVVHMADKDWGYAEAIRFLVDDEFRIEEVAPKVNDERMELEIEIYNEMREEGQAKQIIQTIQNRFTQLERDAKLWDSISQKPLRDENGKCKINFRKWMDGDEDGAYLVLVYIPKDGVSQTYRKFLFAHYFMKIWNVALSREKGFAGREYRPETEVFIDEIHQILDVPTVAKMFVDLYKEPRKYSLKISLSLHGWSSISKAGRTLENDIKQSIMDNGCNLVMLKGGRDAFQSLEHFLQGMSVEDYDNLMNMEWCGIFGMQWNNKYHVFQAKLPLPVDHKDSGWKKYDDWDLHDLASYESPYSRSREYVRAENVKRLRSMLKKSIKDSMESELSEGVEWAELKKVGIKD